MKVVRLSVLEHRVVIFMMHLTSYFISLVYISLALFHSLESNKMSDRSEQFFKRSYSPNGNNKVVCLFPALSETASHFKAHRTGSEPGHNSLHKPLCCGRAGRGDRKRPLLTQGILCFCEYPIKVFQIKLTAYSNAFCGCCQRGEAAGSTDPSPRWAGGAAPWRCLAGPRGRPWCMAVVCRSPSVGEAPRPGLAAEEKKLGLGRALAGGSKGWQGPGCPLCSPEVPRREEGWLQASALALAAAW